MKDHNYEEELDHEIDDSLNDEPDYFNDIELEPDFQLDSEYNDEELERRRVAYADLKKNDKIFNNTYNLGLDGAEEDEDFSAGPENKIKIESGSADYNLYDSEKYLEHVDLTIVQRDIYNFIVDSPDVKAIIGDEPDKRKFVKSEINSLFDILVSGLAQSNNAFVSPIHILDAISSTVNMEYKKLFDMLSYSNKELLLLELNSKYGFLDTMGKNHKMF